jgi:GcrA cell cycle regulator
MSWTDERVDRLKALWNDGLSAAQIATELGAGLTRNAVIGKITRLGLGPRAKAPSEARPTIAPIATPARNADAWRAAQKAPKKKLGRQLPVSITSMQQEEPASADVPEPVEIPQSERVALLGLSADACRWPIGDPGAEDFRFCGAKVQKPGASYCGYHAGVSAGVGTRSERDALRAARKAR